jgi:Cu-Zn family superoxide dismutase
MSIQTASIALSSCVLALSIIACDRNNWGNPQDPSETFQTGQNGDAPAPGAVAEDPDTLAAEFVSQSGSSIRGSVDLTEVAGGVRVSVTFENVPRTGPHGIHFHERADCSGQGFTSAGEHLDPEGKPHGLPGSGNKHFGDLGNIEIRADGSGTMTTTLERASLKPDQERTLVGSALILHAGEDTGEQPSGESGAYIACAEIKRRNDASGTRMKQPDTTGDMHHEDSPDTREQQSDPAGLRQPFDRPGATQRSPNTPGTKPSEDSPWNRTGDEETPDESRTREGYR